MWVLVTMLLTGALFLPCVWAQKTGQVAAPGGDRVEDLVENGGFEGESRDAPAGGFGHYPEGWGVHITFNGTVEPVEDPQHVHCGKKAVRMLNPVRMKKPDHGEQYRLRLTNRSPIYVNPHYTYVFTFWAKGRGDITLYAYETTPSGRFVGTDAWGYRTRDRQPLTAQWQRYAFEYQSSHDMVGRISIGIEVLGEGADAYVDDAAFLLDRNRYPKPPTTMQAKAELRSAADTTLFVNGEQVKGSSLTLRSGENVIGIKAVLPPDGKAGITGAIVAADGRSVPVDESWKVAAQAPEGWLEAGFDDRKWGHLTSAGWDSGGSASLHLRCSVYLEMEPTQNWLAGNPKVFYFPRGSVEYMAAVLRAPTDSPVSEFSIVVEVPEFLRLLDPTRVPDRSYRAAKGVKEETVKIGAANYRRYTIRYDWSAPASVELLRGWKRKDNKGKVLLGLLAFRMEGEPERKSYPIYLRRVANGNASDLTRTVTLRVAPPFGNKVRPKKIVLWHVPVPYGWGAAGELMAGELEKYAEIGYNWVHTSLADPKMRADEGYVKAVRKLLAKGIRIGAWWNTGMNYQVKMEDKKAADFSGPSRALLGHPELWGKWYDGPKDAMPKTWQRAVAHKWFRQQILWDKEYREKNKPVIWCQEYLAQGGEVYLDAWRKELSPVKKQWPEIKYLFWDWEYNQIGYSTFNDLDLQAFRKHAGLAQDVELSAEVIARKYSREWEDFRLRQTGRHCRVFKKMLNEIGLELWVYSGGTRYPGPGTHLYWKYLIGATDAIFLGSPGGYPHIWPDSLVKGGNDIREWFGKDMPLFGQLIRHPEVSVPDATILPSQRKNDILRCCTLFRGGVNVWSNIRGLCDYNGTDHFNREAFDVLAKYESHILDGPRCSDEFAVTGLLHRDLVAFRLEGQPALLLVFNDHGIEKKVTVRWAKAGAEARYIDGETGKAVGKGKEFALDMAPSTVAVIECR